MFKNTKKIKIGNIFINNIISILFKEAKTPPVPPSPSALILCRNQGAAGLENDARRRPFHFPSTRMDPCFPGTTTV